MEFDAIAFLKQGVASRGSGLLLGPTWAVHFSTLRAFHDKLLSLRFQREAHNL